MASEHKKIVSFLEDNGCWQIESHTLADNFKQFIPQSMHSARCKYAAKTYSDPLDDTCQKIKKYIARERFIKNFIAKKYDPNTYFFDRNNLLQNYLKQVKLHNINKELIQKMVNYGIDATTPNICKKTSLYLCLELGKNKLVVPKDILDIFLQQPYVNINYQGYGEDDLLGSVKFPYYEELTQHGCLLSKAFDYSYYWSSIFDQFALYGMRSTNSGAFDKKFNKKLMDAVQAIINNHHEGLHTTAQKENLCIFKQIQQDIPSIFRQDWFNLFKRNKYDYCQNKKCTCQKIKKAQ